MVTDKTELTNMVMVQDPTTGKVLMQKRVKYWKGYSFPGGHVEPHESFTESAVRELKEETGYDIRNLTFCGIIHWCHSVTNRRYLVFCYRTSDFSGQLRPETEEGHVAWMDLSSMKEEDFAKYGKELEK